MAIFSLNHRWVGRSTHQARTAGAHVRYITRPDAATHVMGARMPTDRHEARSWMDAQEQADRKNARVCDKVMVALPRELTHEQRIELVRDYAESMTGGRASWMAAIHDRAGIDDDNPHAHIIFRDRDFETGKRVMQLSEMGGTNKLRATWEDYANLHLELAGSDARIDRRSLAAQGIERTPGIHVGNTPGAMNDKGTRPESRPRELVRHVHGEHKPIIVPYPEIDHGRTRAEANEEILRANRSRSSSSHGLDWTERAGMAAQQRSALGWFGASQLRHGYEVQKEAPPPDKKPPLDTGERKRPSFDEIYNKDGPGRERDSGRER